MSNLNKAKRDYLFAKQIQKAVEKQELKAKQDFASKTRTVPIMWETRQYAEFRSYLEKEGLADAIIAANSMVEKAEDALLKEVFLLLPGWDEWKSLIEAANTNRELKEEVIKIAFSYGDQIC